jgi:hypothetical protein
MSQHDFNIANQGFPATRADLNNALAALASSSAGTSEPSTTYAGQMWNDTTNNLLKFRNDANDAWITFAKLDQATNEWEVRSSVFQAVDSAGIAFKTDEGTTRATLGDDGNFQFNSLTATTFTSTGIDDNASSTAITLDSSGNVGIGTASPTSKLTLAAGDKIFVPTGESLNFGHTDGATNTEAMRIDSSGNLLVGTPSPINSAGENAINVLGSVVEPRWCMITKTHSRGRVHYHTSTGGGISDFFVVGSTTVGSISQGATSTTYATSSDYRLKTDAQPITGAAARVQALNPVNFAWIATGTRVDGFLAHEAQAVVPEAATGTKDAMRDEEYEVSPAVLDDDGDVVTEAVMGTRSVPDYQGIDQSKLVPLLTAALQEALTEITDLKARITALEAI